MVHKINTKVISNKKITPSVVILSFSVPEEFDFKAGQFVTVMVEKDGERKPRSYSILNPPSQKGKLDLCIKIVEDGFASSVFENATEGDEFEIKGPFGHFVYSEDENEEVWMLSAGTGVVPFYSMLKEHLSSSKKKFTLLFGVKRKEDLCFDEEFRGMVSERFDYKPVLSREDWDGLQGHVQDHLPDNLENKTFYICGLKELVLETKELLTSKGVNPENIKSERYS